MQEFDKWDKNAYPLPPCIERGSVGRECLRQRRQTWRTAFERILDECGHYKSQEVIDFIRAEVKE